MQRSLTILALAAMYAFTPAAAASTWAPQTSPTAVALNGVAHADSNTWIAVGDGGTIVRSTNGGVAWSTVTSPIGDQLHGVAFRGNLGLAVGIGGRILRSTDAGAHWTLLARPISKIFFAVAIADSFAVITGEEGRIYVSTDDGLTWTAHFAGTASALFGVAATGDAAIGVGGAGAVVMSTFRGSAWGLTVIGTQLTFFYGMCMVSPSTGWLAGTSSTIPTITARTDAGGFVWQGESPPSTDQLFGISFMSPTSGTTVGGTGTILHTDDGGVNWSPETSGVTATLNAVSFTPTGLGIAVGAAGTILRATPDVVAGVWPPAGAPPRLALAVLGNPARGAGLLRLAAQLPSAGVAHLRVLDASGRVVFTFPEQVLAAGTHEFAWDGTDQRGARVPAGIYLAEIRTGWARVSTKLVRID